MKVILSGGNAGGLEVEWPEGEEIIIVEGHKYELRDNVAVFVGAE